MIAPKDELPEESKSESLFPGSSRVYVQGKIHPEVKVAMREVGLSPTNHPSGKVEENPPVRVYDTSGPWGDPDFDGDVEKGLPAMRRDWILARGDVEEYEGRDVTPADNGYLSDKHADRYNENKSAKNKLTEYPGLKTTRSPRCGMPNKASSHPRWNTSPSVKTSAAKRITTRLKTGQKTRATR